eukprot:EG_transcript_32296
MGCFENFWVARKLISPVAIFLKLKFGVISGWTHTSIPLTMITSVSAVMTADLEIKARCHPGARGTLVVTVEQLPAGGEPQRGVQVVFLEEGPRAPVALHVAV